MDSILYYKNEEIIYTLRRRRGYRRLTVRIQSATKIVVTTALSTPLPSIEQFLYTKADWILESLNYFRTHRETSFSEGKKYHEHKARAKKFIMEKLKKYNEYYGYTYKKVSIRDQSTRWGSCSATGTLSFSYKLLFLPEALAEYVVVHEICHLQEMNHGRAFWQLVGERIPNYRTLRGELKKYSLG